MPRLGGVRCDEAPEQEAVPGDAAAAGAGGGLAVRRALEGRRRSSGRCCTRPTPAPRPGWRRPTATARCRPTTRLPATSAWSPARRCPRAGRGDGRRRGSGGDPCGGRGYRSPGGRAWSAPGPFGPWTTTESRRTSSRRGVAGVAEGGRPPPSRELVQAWRSTETSGGRGLWPTVLVKAAILLVPVGLGHGGRPAWWPHTCRRRRATAARLAWSAAGARHLDAGPAGRRAGWTRRLAPAGAPPPPEPRLPRPGAEALRRGA